MRKNNLLFKNMLGVISIVVLGNISITESIANAPTRNVELCTKASEALTIKRFSALYKERAKTPEGAQDVINRIKDLKRKTIIRSQGDPMNNLTLLSTKDGSNVLYNQIEALKKDPKRDQNKINELIKQLEALLKPKKDAIKQALSSITADPNNDQDIALISTCSMDNNVSDRYKDGPNKGRIIQFSSPFEFGLQAIKQCRDKKNGQASDPEVPDLWQGEELP